MLVEVAPAGLDHPDIGGIEGRDGAQQEVGKGEEVGIEDGDVFAFGQRQGLGQGAGLETLAWPVGRFGMPSSTCTWSLSPGYSRAMTASRSLSTTYFSL